MPSGEIVAVYLLDATGHIISWNQEAQALKGYGKQEVLGAHITALYPPAQVRLPILNMATAISHGEARDVGWRYHKDGTRFWAETILTAIFDDEHLLTGFAKIIRSATPPPDALAEDEHP